MEHKERHHAGISALKRCDEELVLYKVVGYWLYHKEAINLAAMPDSKLMFVLSILKDVELYILLKYQWEIRFSLTLIMMVLMY